jgi:integrase/recombinase XerC
MGNVRQPQIRSVDWLGEGPLAPHVDAFRRYLTERGYARNSLAGCLSSVAHFAQWIHRRGIDVQRIDESVLVEFLDAHLPSCRCIGVTQRHRPTLSAALGHLLVVLRAQGVIAPPLVSKTPVHDELVDYGEYMLRVRGLARTTQAMGLGIVRRFLTWRFGDYAMDVTAIKPEHVRHFFAQEAKRYSKPASAGTVVAALRGYFRYRAFLGDVVHGLIGALSCPANWQLASLPMTHVRHPAANPLPNAERSGRPQLSR